jgi:hypothetical protein
MVKAIAAELIRRNQASATMLADAIVLASAIG